MNAYSSLRALCLVTIIGLWSSACSSDSGSKQSGMNDSIADSGAPAPVEAGPKSPMPFNGDCSTARWGHQSDACWSCLCDACADTLNKCNEDCVGIMECATSKHALVNVTSDISCEVRATTLTCLTDPKSQAQAQALINFDSCLLSATPGKPAGEFRTCDTVCKNTYSGDVCQRFPEQPAM